MTLLSLVQDHCAVHALNIPLSVVGSQDTTVKQLLGLANSLAADMIDESNWQAFTSEALWTLVVGENQGSICDVIVPNSGYLYAKNGTFFDRTQRRPLYGPVSDDEWQALKAIPNPGPWYKYRIRGDDLLINPAPAIGGLSVIAFEYGSSWAIKSAAGARKPYFTADDDKTVLPERIFAKGLAYRWKELKGLPFAPEQDRYYKMLNNYIARDGTARQYNMAEPNEPMLRPGIFVPSGNWPV